MWKYPWKYAEGIVICIGLFVTGAVLQFTIGPIVLEYLKYPLNLIFGIIYCVILVAFYFLSKHNKYIFWFSKSEAAITSIVSLLILVIIMGFTRQEVIMPIDGHPHKNIGDWNLGFHQMTRSWIFALLFLYFLNILGLATIRRLASFKWKDFTFAMNHLGLFIALLAGVLGSADMQRLRMQTQLGQPEWRATTDDGQMVELPIAIELQSFTIEQYPPKLLVISNETGEALPKKQPHNLLVEETPIKGKLLDWEIEVTEFLPMAASVITQDTVKYVNFETHGATSAVYVKAKKDEQVKEGWVSAGNHMFPHRALTLNDEFSVVMPEREPKKYASGVNVYVKDGEDIQTTIEVNKPLEVEGWKIYQLSYDEVMGRWSNISIFELVRDPWLPYVYLGIIMMLIGSVGLFLVAKRKDNK
ncbi:respiratory nitrite reductase-specific cytochrome c biogenesis protein NrfK /respiratory nitrite reductase-specific cytochrome c biogenesis protein NrfL [Balneicella halophila]|uniref:Respiratory nitrite reductase-specific cytochrome c biogenesis protein NrfK /respiratory nitrite reductase-specific cytochrome c biogenesis protein NrfL n=1 Tax=Balneicella halophila TaxID=1537566 RepID=A0A7L4UQY8_BALHA|nr:cytochrome c biogenesis protein ResB [Balneicella halophila]PVX51022.1 respiratory nitrite reductase-specific cytochrome c biogenesis protein NrfK /respiratory nitrite reductase-specific cytochrome c biogenesis protein NrfL [Balneicella halophila]